MIQEVSASSEELVKKDADFTLRCTKGYHHPAQATLHIRLHLELASGPTHSFVIVGQLLMSIWDEQKLP